MKGGFIMELCKPIQEPAVSAYLYSLEGALEACKAVVKKVVNVGKDFTAGFVDGYLSNTKYGK